MGNTCGKNKGKSETEPVAVTEIEFKTSNVNSMDHFFIQAKNFLDSVKDITGPLGDQKDSFFDVTGFYEVPGAGKQRHSR